MNDNGIVGIPPMDDFVSVDIYQRYGDTCAIRSQQLILRDFGVNMLQEQLMAEAHEHGWYDGHGTSGQNIGNLLEDHGVGVSRYENANVNDLVKALAEGKKVIVGVDGHELWGHEPPDASADDHTPNHALIVAGVDTKDPDDIKVILTDPGTGEVAKVYPLDDFKASWADSHNLMVVTNDPVPGMPNFDYEAGHITGDISGQSYEEWCAQHEDDFSHPYQVGEDTDGNGTIDTWNMDYNRDGVVDEQLIDVDGDGIADGTLDEIAAIDMMSDEGISEESSMDSDVLGVDDPSVDGDEDLFMTSRM